jgi:superfamily II DNA or RNA helicase
VKTVFDIYDYRESSKFLQDKYGHEHDYFRLNPDGTLKISDKTGLPIKNTKVGRGAEGLQYHHIREDIVPSLSTAENAMRAPAEYQKAENMCYGNLLEHAWEHILIAEQNVDVADNAQEYLTGPGGVQWMLLAINSIMCNADTSWYSSKNEEGKGCNYNYNNIITDNKAAWHKVVNRFCTSAFIRQRLDKTPLELLEMICILPTKDGAEGGRLAVYEELLPVALDTKLFDCNVGAFADLLTYFKTEQSALICICTGGGKTTTALEYLRLIGGKALVLGPGDTIKSGWEEERNWKDLGASADVVNYQTFMNDYKTRDLSQYSVIICDEAHHLEAERWGEGVVYALKATDIKIIGLTATPTSNQIDGKDKLFSGRVCYGLDLAEGIKNGTIWPFDYIQSIYRMEDVKEEFAKYGSVGTLLWERLNLAANENPIESILKKHMPKNRRKVIVFVSCVDEIPMAEAILRKYDPNCASTSYMRSLTCKMSDDVKTDTKFWFDDKKTEEVDYSVDTHNKYLITVAMVNEGAHYDGINTLIMFRRTNSTRLYLQQLGRIVVNCKKTNPHGVVFDFTNNAEHLIYNSDYCTYEGKPSTASTETIKRIKEALSEKEVICEDYTEDCVATLSALNDAKDKDRHAQRIYQVFEDTVTELTNSIPDLEDWFSEELWAELKTRGAGSKSTKAGRPKHATSEESKKVADVIAEDLGTAGTKDAKKSAKASAVERLAHAFRLGLKRAYASEYISFSDDATCTLTIDNPTEFNTIWVELGFKNTTIIEAMLDKLGTKFVFLTAANL